MNAYLIDGIRTPVGSFGGALASVRADDLAAHVIQSLMERHPDLDPKAIDDVIMGTLCSKPVRPVTPDVAAVSTPRCRMALRLLFRKSYPPPDIIGFCTLGAVF